MANQVYGNKDAPNMPTDAKIAKKGFFGFEPEGGRYITLKKLLEFAFLAARHSCVAN